MRLLHTADWHLSADRLKEQEAALEQLIADASEEDVDAVIFAGDVFDTRRPGPREIAVFVRAMRRLDVLRKTVIVAPGNHDGPEAIEEHEGKTTAWLREIAWPNVHAFTRHETRYLLIGGKKVPVTVLPYPHRRSFAGELTNGATLEQRIEHVAKRTSQIIRDSAKMGGLFVGHLSVAGARLPVNASMLLGWDVTVLPDVFDGYEYAALGHIHVRQRVADNAWYPGVPIRMGFDDDDLPGWLYVDTELGAPISVSNRSATNFRSYRLLQSEVAQGLDLLVVDDGDHVRLTIVQDTKERITPKQLRSVEDALRRKGAAAARALAENLVVARDGTRALDPKATPEDHLRAWAVSQQLGEEETTRLVSLARDLLDAV